MAISSYDRVTPRFIADLNTNLDALAVAINAITAVINIKDFGAKGDGTTDDSGAFQAAVDELKTHSPAGGTIVMPPGIYRLARGITIDSCFELVGAGWSESMPGIDAQVSGTWLKIDQTTDPAFLVSGLPARGTSFRNFGVIQSHPTPGPGWAPTVYAPVFRCDHVLGEVSFSDLFLPGIYQGIDSQTSGRLTMWRIRGQTFSFLANIDNDGPSDTNHISNIHVWDYWSADSHVITWQQANGVGFKLGRVDSIQGADAFIWGQKAGLHLAGNPTWGPATSIHFGDFNADACLYAIWDTDTTSIAFDGFGGHVSIGHLHHGGMTGSNTIQSEGHNFRIAVDQITPVTVGASIVNATYTGSDIGSVFQIGKVNAHSFSKTFNLDGGNAMFTLAAKTGDSPHQLILSDPVFPPDGGEIASSTVSGLVNKVLTTGAANVFDPGKMNWLYMDVASSTSYQIPNWCGEVHLNSPGAITGVTYAMPDQPRDGQSITFVPVFNQTVTLTSAAAFENTVTAFTAGQSVTFRFLAPRIVWARVA